MASLLEYVPRLDVIRSDNERGSNGAFSFVFTLHRYVAVGRTRRAGQFFDHLGNELSTDIATTDAELFRSLLIIPTVGCYSTNTAIRYGR